MYQDDKDKKTDSQFRCGLALYFLIFQFALNLLFGVILIVFRNNDNYNDACDSDTFKSWVLATSIILFIISGKSFCAAFADPKVLMMADVCFSLVILIIAIGVHATSDSSCGQLYKVVQAFSITQYLLQVIKIITTIKVCRTIGDK